MKMSVVLKTNRFLLMCLMFFLISSSHGQDQLHNVSFTKNNVKADNGIEQKPTSLFGSRVSSSFMNQEFTLDVSERSPSVGKRNSIFGNTMEYGSQMTTLKQNRQTNFMNPVSQSSNRKKVKRMQKMKTALQNIRKNASDSLHRSYGSLRNVGFSNGNTVHVNSQPNVYSDMNKMSNPFHIQKDTRNYQGRFNHKSRASPYPYKTVESTDGSAVLNGNMPSNLFPPFNFNVSHKLSDEYPGKEISIPCSCFWTNQKCGCSCNDSLMYDDFQELSKLFRPCSNFSFTITGGQHFSLPPNLFTRIGQVQNIHMMITNATFDYLFDATPYTSAFRGVSFENTALIELLGVRVQRAWNWTPLKYLNSSSGAGVEIKLEGCGLRRLSSDFGKVADGKVRTASISDSRLEMIGSGAFSSFNDLTHFILPRNRLRSIKRTDLPVEPSNLVEIDLRNNQLQFLEADLFTEMPSLQQISLAGNPLGILPETTFSSVIGRTSVQGLSDFPLYCDCRLRWLKNSSFVHNDVVLSNLKGMVCKRPPYLRGTPFKDLSKEHLMC